MSNQTLLTKSINYDPSYGGMQPTNLGFLHRGVTYWTDGKAERIFIGTSGGGNLLRAFDKATGKVIAEINLTATPHGTPMTYMAGGKQYVVVATYDGRLTALSLP